MNRRERLLARIQSRAPTRYAIVSDAGPDAHLFCAYDGVLFALLTGSAVDLRADPPVGSSFRAHLTTDGPARPDLWLTFVERDAPLPHARGQASNRCPFMHLFEERAQAESWRRTVPEAIASHVTVLPFADAWPRARAQVESLGDAGGRA